MSTNLSLNVLIVMMFSRFLSFKPTLNESRLPGLLRMVSGLTVPCWAGVFFVINYPHSKVFTNIFIYFQNVFSSIFFSNTQSVCVFVALQ